MIFTKPDKSSIQNWFIEYISQTMDIPREKINIRQPLEEFGLDSITIVQLTMHYEEWTNQKIDLDVLYEKSTIERIAGYLSEE